MGPPSTLLVRCTANSCNGRASPADQSLRMMEVEEEEEDDDDEEEEDDDEEEEEEDDDDDDDDDDDEEEEDEDACSTSMKEDVSFRLLSFSFLSSLFPFFTDHSTSTAERSSTFKKVVSLSHHLLKCLTIGK